MISFLYWWLFKPSKRTLELQKELLELKRQEARITQAYALYKDVYFNYGPEWAALMADPDTIINDDKPITIINYLNTDNINFVK